MIISILTMRLQPGKSGNLITLKVLWKQTHIFFFFSIFPQHDISKCSHALSQNGAHYSLECVQRLCQIFTVTAGGSICPVSFIEAHPLFFLKWNVTQKHGILKPRLISTMLLTFEIRETDCLVFSVKHVFEDNLVPANRIFKKKHV